MKWKKEISYNGAEYQIDTVGNIYQLHGGVKPKACQKCKKEFKSERKEIPIKQKIRHYNCTKCKFNTSSYFLAEDHTIETKHKIKEKIKERISGYNIILEGRIPNIIKTKNDVLILCGDCKDGLN